MGECYYRQVGGHEAGRVHSKTPGEPGLTFKTMVLYLHEVHSHIMDESGRAKRMECAGICLQQAYAQAASAQWQTIWEGHK